MSAAAAAGAIVATSAVASAPATTVRRDVVMVMASLNLDSIGDIQAGRIGGINLPIVGKIRT
ncbi:hypothetical protein GCM10009676_40810 [Prauserella halophila]|uniref:Uncharacterized protein n=1 Tax=Prauserella halophila TaxID=185641 RepID=A0ABP4H7W6_9PSEU